MSSTEPTLTDFNDAAPPPPRIGTENDDQAPVNAPWGLRRDGTPARKPGRPAGSRTRRAARTAARSAPSTPKPPKATTATKKATDRRAPIRLILKGLAYLGAFLPAYQLDAWTITEYQKPLTELGNAYADKIPWIAGLLDKIAGIGGDAEHALILIPFTMQVLVNHGTIPAEMAQQFAPSVRSREQIIAAMQATANATMNPNQYDQDAA